MSSSSLLAIFTIPLLNKGLLSLEEEFFNHATPQWPFRARENRDSRSRSIIQLHSYRVLLITIKRKFLRYLLTLLIQSIAVTRDCAYLFPE